VKPGCLLLLLALLCSPALAQAEEDLLELEADELAARAWTDLYSELEAAADSLGLGSRLYLNPSSQYSLHTVLWRSKANSALFNLRHDFEDGDNLANYTLQLDTGKLNLILGSYRFRFGRGIISGNGSRSLPPTVLAASRPSSPSRYTPFGIWLGYRHNLLSAALFGSSQSRLVTLSGEDIASLAVSREERLSRSREGIFGAAVGYGGKTLRAGALLWHQEYDRDFASGELSSDLWAYSLYACLDKGPSRLDWEAAGRGGGWHHLLNWNLSLGRFSQNLSFAANPPQGQYPYALSPSLLDRGGGKQEYGYDASLSWPGNLKLRLRYNLNQGGDPDGERLSRLLASLSHSDENGSASLSWASFDRELIALVDTAYASSLPVNQRLYLTFQRRVASGWDHRLSFSYHYQDREDYGQNTYRLELSFGYASGRLRLRAGWQFWHSPRDYYALDEENPYYYSIDTGDDSRLLLSAEYRTPRYRVSLSCRQSILDHRQRQLYLRLGLGMPRFS
jgi:hypothetical protein